MSNLPQGWVTAPIGELCSLKNGRAFKPSEWQSSGVPIVRIQNLNNASASYNYYQGKADERHRLKGGELLFAWSGTPGTSFGAHIWQGGEAVLNQHIFRVDFDGAALDKRFFRFAINEKLNDLIGVAQGGVGLRHVTKGVFESTPILVPPRAEQTRIADQLDTLLARVNACNDHLDAIPGILKRFRQAVLTAALTGDLLDEFDDLSAKAPRKTAKISDIASVGTGSTPLRSNSGFYASAGTPWVTSAATGSPFVVDADQFVTDAAITAHRLKVYLKGTLLVAMYGEGKTRGQVSELAIDATINQACAAISVDETLATRQFVKLALTANYLVMRELAEGGNQPNLNLSKIKEFEIPLPALDEQARIVGEVEGLLKLADRVEARYTAMRAHAQRLAPQVLAKAFRGELVEQDPKDEPASVLLQRLVATTSAKAPSSRGRPRAQPEAPATLPAPQAPAPIDWHTLPNNDWAAPAAAQDQAITACLTAVLKAWGQPMPELEARLATLLCQQPRVLTTVLPAAQAKQWVRLVGDEAKPLPAQVARLQPASNSPWGQAIKRMRARGDLVEAGSADGTTWSLGQGASAIITAGWPDGRAAFVVAHLHAHGVASILPALAPADQAFVHVRAA